MKPLFLTYSSRVQPYLRMAQALYRQIDELKAGDYYHLCLDEPGANRNFYAECYARLHVKFDEAIDHRPVIILDADHVLRHPIMEIFKLNWDVAAVYRKRCRNKYGRQDYCAGLVMFNDKYPDVVRRFYSEWLENMKARPPVPGFCPATLKNDGWLDTWWIDQSALNDIIAPVEGEAEQGKVYIIEGYRILPLRNEEYGTKGVFIKHFKGGKKF